MERQRAKRVHGIPKFPSSGICCGCPPQSGHVGDGGRAGLQVGRGARSALAVDGRVVLERGAPRGVSFGEAPEMSGQGAARGHVLGGAPLLREFQHQALLLGGKPTACGQGQPGRGFSSSFSHWLRVTNSCSALELFPSILLAHSHTNCSNAFHKIKGFGWKRP